MVYIDIIKIICSEFDLGTLVEFRIGTEGVTNEKYRITTDRGRYFVKVIKNKENSDISHTCAVEQYMKAQGIPAVAMIGNIRGGMWMRLEGVVYTVYPFIESDRRHDYSPAEFEKIGALLGKMHWVGQSNIPREFLLYFSEKPKRDVGISALKSMRETIEKRPEVNDTDRKFLDYLEYKINLAQTIPEGSMFMRDTIVHGDFHPGNLLFDPASREIVGVCDWEKSEYGSRASDLAHSIIYTCFHKGYVYEKALESARSMLKGYILEYPISYPEFIEGLSAHVYSIVFALWIEDKYYNKNKIDIANVIDHEKSVLTLCREGKLADLIFHSVPLP